jgi:ribosomal protein L7/L12
MAELNPQDWQAIADEIFAGNKIAAIKRYRDLVPGAGLADAKQAVEKIEADLRRAQPEKFQASAKKSGCGAAAVAAVISMVAVLVVLVLRATG